MTHPVAMTTDPLSDYGGVEAQAGRVEVFNAEEVAAAAPWDGRINQILSGSYHATLEYVKTPGMVLYVHHERHGIEGFGTLPTGLVVLGANVDSRRPRAEWCGRALDGHCFAVGSPGAEIGFTIPASCRNVVLLADPAFLARSLGPQAADSLRGHQHLELSSVNGRRLIATMTGIVEKYARGHALLKDPLEVRSLQSTFLAALNPCIGHRSRGERSEPSPPRELAVRRAIEFAERSVVPITAPELAAAAEVSQRTLQDYFREILGVSPGMYLRRHRLNMAYRALTAADPSSSTITHIALSWGFSHPGRFSVEYRKLFGEKPSETLARPRHPSTSPLLDPSSGASRLAEGGDPEAEQSRQK